MTIAVCHFVDGATSLSTPFFRSMARLYDRSRFQVAFCTIEETDVPQGGDWEGVRLFGLGASRREYPKAVAKLAALLIRERFHIVHAHFFEPTAIAYFAARLTRRKVVFTRHHADNLIRMQKRWHIGVDSFMGRHSDHAIAVSEATRRVMIEVEHVTPDRVTVVHNGLNPLTADAARTEAVRKELGLSGPVCLMIARLHEEKGHRFLVAALPSIVARMGPVNVLFAGEGPLRPELDQQITALGMGKMVRFLGRRPDVAELIALSDVLVLPSLAESFGLAVLEAMSLGKPVVATTVGGIPEVLVDGETGILVPPAAVEPLADAICRILSEPAMAQRFGAAGQKRAPLFSAERMIRGYESVYSRVAQR